MLYHRMREVLEIILMYLRYKENVTLLIWYLYESFILGVNNDIYEQFGYYFMSYQKINKNHWFSI